MNETLIKIIINIIIGIVVFFGFFAFWGRSSGWFIEGGLVYEFLRKRKEEKIKKRQQLKAQKRAQANDVIQTKDD